MEKEGIDFFNPAIVMALLMAVMSDAAFITLPFWFVPAIGLVIAAVVLLFHYFAAFFLFFLVLPKLRHFIPKLVFFIALILPLPTLSLGIILALILQNRLIEALAVEAATQVVAGALAATGVGAPAAAAVEAAGQTAAVGATTLETGVAATEAGAAATEAAEVAGGAKEIAEAGEAVGEIAPGAGGAPKGRPSEMPEVKPEGPEGRPSETPTEEKKVTEKELGLEEEPGEVKEMEELRDIMENLPEPEEKEEGDEEEDEEEDQLIRDTDKPPRPL